MASAALKAELECAVCLNIYTDPVMLKCGHNFCRLCIDRVLDTQAKSGGYSCPECRQSFYERPALHRNIKLGNIVDNILSDQPDQEDTRDFCSIHKKILEYYCTEDDTCVCVSCCLIGEHTGHKMESLKEASGKKMNKMREDLQNLLTKKEKTEEKIQSLQNCRRNIERNAAGGTDRVTALFGDICRQLNVLKEKVLSEISRQAQQISLSMLDLIQELETEKEKISRNIHQVEELCNTMDPLTVLQKSNASVLCETEDDKVRQRHQVLDGEKLDMAGILQTFQAGLSDIMSGVNVQKQTSTDVYPNISTENIEHIIAARSQGIPQPASTIQTTHHQPGSSHTVLKMLGLSKVTDIILDTNTAGNDLCISDNREIVSFSVFTQKYPETPGRFQCAQVLSTQSFSSGKHYWEVDVEKSQAWSAGMCYPSISRRGCHAEIGWNNKSWGLHKSWLNNQYSVLYDRHWNRLPGKVFSNRVRIYLDYEAGQISFYDLCDTIQHLHTFSATFTEPLHAVLWVGGGCAKICRGNQNI